jgi:hypothetical protein
MTNGHRLELLFELVHGSLGRSVKPDLLVLLESLPLFRVPGCQRLQRLCVFFCRLFLRSIGFLLELLELFLDVLRYPLLVKLLGTSQYRSRTMHPRTYVDTAHRRNSIFQHRKYRLARLGSQASNLVRMIQCGGVRGILMGR